MDTDGHYFFKTPRNMTNSRFLSTIRCQLPMMIARPDSNKFCTGIASNFNRKSRLLKMGEYLLPSLAVLRQLGYKFLGFLGNLDTTRAHSLRYHSFIYINSLGVSTASRSPGIFVPVVL